MLRYQFARRARSAAGGRVLVVAADRAIAVGEAFSIAPAPGWRVAGWEWMDDAAARSAVGGLGAWA
jgi:hypothetical protein